MHNTMHIHRPQPVITAVCYQRAERQAPHGLAVAVRELKATGQGQEDDEGRIRNRLVEPGRWRERFN